MDKGKEARRTDVDAGELQLIRNALAESTEVRGLRATARELRMSASGLRNFIEGTAPYGKTLRRAQAWYAEWSHRHGSLDVADETAIRVLVATVPEERRQRAAERLEALIERLRRS